MIGLIFLVALIIWIVVAYVVGNRIPRWLKLRQKWNLLFVPLVFFLPALDEAIGEVQLRYLCSSGAVVQIDEERARGAQLILKYDPETLRYPYPTVPSRAVPWTVLNTMERTFELFTVDNDLPVIKFKSYSNGQSFLSGLLGGHRPAFASGVCPGEDTYEKLQRIIDSLNVTIINRNK